MNLSLLQQGKWCLFGFCASGICFCIAALCWILFCKRTTVQHVPIEMIDTYYYQIEIEESEHSAILQTEI